MGPYIKSNNFPCLTELGQQLDFIQVFIYQNALCNGRSLYVQMCQKTFNDTALPDTLFHQMAQLHIGTNVIFMAIVVMATGTLVCQYKVHNFFNMFSRPFLSPLHSI